MSPLSRSTFTPPRTSAVRPPQAPIIAPKASARPPQVDRMDPIRESPRAASKGKVLILLPENGNDPGETAIPYARFKQAGYDVVFATASGKAGHPDTLSFRSPLLKASRPDAEGKAAFAQMMASKEHQRPVTFAQALARNDFAALYVPGGEGPGMLPFLDDERAHAIVRKFYARQLPAAFLCHGGLMAARTINPATGKSVIAGEKVTTIPKNAERLGIAAFLGSGRPRVYGALGGNYAADEMARAAGNGNFVQPELGLKFRDPGDRRNVVSSGNQVFGGGPWDARPFAEQFVELLEWRHG